MTGDQSLLKRINRMALVRLVKAKPGLSRVDLANLTGLTKATVGALAQELIDEGWLHQSEPSVGQGVGRRPMPLTLDTSRIGLIGAEVGVDYLNVVTCNLQGEILYSRLIPYRHDNVARSVRKLCGLIAGAHARLVSQKRRPLGVGVGIPGMFDVRDGILRFAPNIGWHDVAIRDEIRAALTRVGCGHLRLSVLNDANAGALSEYVFGTDHHTNPLVYLSMGIGLGAGVVLRDRLYEGHDGLAGEVGHTILQRRGPLCSCGRHGCAETFVSQRAVSRFVTGRDSPILGIQDLAERMARGDKVTLRAARRSGEYLGLLMQNLGNTINPAVMVLGGPLCQLGEVFISTALRAMKENSGRYDYHRVSIRLCRFGLNACAVGAAGNVLQEHLHAPESSGVRRIPRPPEDGTIPTTESRRPVPATRTPGPPRAASRASRSPLRFR